MHLQHNSEVSTQGPSQNMYGMIVRAKWKIRKFALKLSCRNNRETIPIIYEQYDYLKPVERKDNIYRHPKKERRNLIIGTQLCKEL